jgi:hypothetical protein
MADHADLDTLAVVILDHFPILGLLAALHRNHARLNTAVPKSIVNVSLAATDTLLP